MPILHHDGAPVNLRSARLLRTIALTLVSLLFLLLAPFCSVATAVLWGNPIRIGGKISGFFLHGAYYRKVQGSKHFLRKPPAITNDLAALAEAERLGADRVRIVDAETGVEYVCIIAVIRQYGTYINRGWGEQIALPFAYWVQTAPDGTITPPTLPKQTPPKPAAQQTFLFDFSESERRGGY